jgi:hypothetical protein
MLLKMHFVDGPQLHLRIVHQGLECFYAPFDVAGLPAPPWGVACVNEIPAGETVSGSGALPSGLHTDV